MLCMEEKNPLKAFDKDLKEDGTTPAATICLRASTAAPLAM
jgi:hypothetical protein